MYKVKCFPNCEHYINVLIMHHVALVNASMKPQEDIYGLLPHVLLFNLCFFPLDSHIHNYTIIHFRLTLWNRLCSSSLQRPTKIWPACYSSCVQGERAWLCRTGKLCPSSCCTSCFTDIIYSCSRAFYSLSLLTACSLSTSCSLSCWWRSSCSHVDQHVPAVIRIMVVLSETLVSAKTKWKTCSKIWKHNSKKVSLLSLLISWSLQRKQSVKSLSCLSAGFASFSLCSVQRR